jgi:hypothetical protein
MKDQHVGGLEPGRQPAQISRASRPAGSRISTEFVRGVDLGGLPAATAIPPSLLVTLARGTHTGQQSSPLKGRRTMKASPL